MRLNRLDLKAFGPFTGRTLVFDSKDPGLHIIFGPNEAGKSSALRALKALLYGFPQQTPDNFLHNYDQLLVGGGLENRNGDKIYFQRRKKRIGDIIDELGNPLDSKKLLPFLHGVDPEVFESLYGIDHDSLIRGGEEILAQKGEVGQALFAAGAGITSLREVIDQLEKEASDLFKSAGQLPEINKSIRRFKELKKETKDASLSIREWQSHQTILKRAVAERTSLEKKREDRHKELRHLERLEQAIPELASLKARQEQLQALGEVIVLSPDFEERHQQVGQKMRAAQSQLQKDSDRLEHIRKNRGAVSFNKALLDNTELVDDFHQRLGEYRKGQKDKPQINGMRISLRREAALLLNQVRPDLRLEDIDILRPVLGKKKTIQSLATRYEVICQQLKQAEKQNKTTTQELERTKKILADSAKVRDFQPLHQAVKVARKAGDIDSELIQGRNEVEQGKRECLTKLKRSAFPFIELTPFMELPLPLPETVRKFDKKYSDLTEEDRELEKEQKMSEGELSSATAEIKKAEYGGNIPSEEDLALGRTKREQGWKLLREQWLDGKDVTAESANYNAEKSLPDAYEEDVVHADFIADRLRREADRVAGRATLRAQVETMEDILGNNKTRREALNQRKLSLDTAWSKTWQPTGISPLTPKEMGGWLVEADKIRYTVAEILKKEAIIVRNDSRRESLKGAVLKELEAIGFIQSHTDDTLGSILAFAEATVEKLEREKLQHGKIKEQSEKAQQTFNQTAGDCTSCREDLVKWQEQWEEALDTLGLTSVVTVPEALDLIEILQNCFDRVKETDDLRKRIDGIDRDAAELTEDVNHLLHKVAPNKLKLPLDQAILQLRTMLSHAQKGSALSDKLSEEFDTLQLEVATAEKTVQIANEEMGELLQIARCKKPEEVAAVITRFVEHQRLLEKISDTGANLARIGLGLSIEELSGQAAKVNADDLPHRFESLRREIDERINPDINAVSQVIGEQTTQLAAMDGSGRGAEIAEKMEQELARIRRLAERYVQTKLASRILQREIERYREKHQDPVLKIASRYFADLTMNSLKGLKTDVDDKGDPILVGIRSDDTWITVDGMSDGTRDQLYLALRLATLESLLDKGEPFPFIVDDILINFDDDRSRATLQALAELGTKNQIILFTHHRQIMEEAKNLQSSKEIHLHDLSA